MKFFPQKRNVSLYVVVFCAGIHSPDFYDQSFFGNQHPGVCHQNLQDFKLLVSQMDGFLMAPQIIGGEI